MGGGVVWVAALLAAMLSLTRLFANDYADGTLEQLMLIPHPPTLWVFGKVAAHWLVTGLPLMLMAPVLGLQYGLLPEALLMQAPLALGRPFAAGSAHRRGVTPFARRRCAAFRSSCRSIFRC
jgi:heme exporter protein B